MLRSARRDRAARGDGPAGRQRSVLRQQSRRGARDRIVTFGVVRRRRSERCCSRHRARRQHARRRRLGARPPAARSDLFLYPWRSGAHPQSRRDPALAARPRSAARLSRARPAPFRVARPGPSATATQRSWNFGPAGAADASGRVACGRGGVAMGLRRAMGSRRKARTRTRRPIYSWTARERSSSWIGARGFL